jgi:transposase-like protein
MRGNASGAKRRASKVVLVMKNRRKHYVYLDVEEPITCRTMDKGSIERGR